MEKTVRYLTLSQTDRSVVHDQRVVTRVPGRRETNSVGVAAAHLDQRLRDVANDFDDFLYGPVLRDEPCTSSDVAR